MKTKGFVLTVITFAMLITLASGCHYRVTDPTTQNAYYTTDIKKLESGSIRFKDKRTGKLITITNSEIESINQDEFDTAIGKIN